MHKLPWRKCFLISIGTLSLGLGLVGIVVPLLPTTPFLLLAAMCFARSSDRLYEWLINHRWFGSYIRNYQAHRAITKQAKIVTLSLLWGTIGYAVVRVVHPWPLRLLLLSVAVGVTAHVLRLKTLTREMILRSAATERECAQDESSWRSRLRLEWSGMVSKCRPRSMLWFLLAVTSVGGGIATDLVLGSTVFPWWVRLLGVLGMGLAYLPLRRTGKLLRQRGQLEKAGCTTRLVTTDLYRCLRHPHHVGVGIFMTSLALFIGRPYSLAIISVSQWVWILGFLILVEEKELAERFGKEYEAYCRQVPMLFPNPVCAIRVLSIVIEDVSG